MGISESLMKAVEHPKFHKVQYGTEKPITIVHFETDAYEINQWRDQFYKKFKHQDQSEYPSLLMVPQQNIKTVRDGFCSEKCKLLIKIQNIWETTLQEQINKRKQIQRYYTEEQIWLFCFNICQTLVPLHSLHETSILGNLHPANILISKQGEILMIGESSLPYERDHYTTFRKKGIKQSYVSPQLIGFLNNVPSKNDKNTPLYPACVDLQKVQSYCLGLTLLALSCLQPSMQSLYLSNARNLNYLQPNVSRQSSSRHNYINLINQTFFNERIHFIETRYSRVLSMVIKGFLQDLPENRLSVSQLWNVFLNQKKGHIKSMDTHWYFQTLEPIDQFNQNQNQAQEEQSGKKSRFGNKNQRSRQVQLKDQESKTYENFYSSNDQRIQIWQRSLQKEQILLMANEKIPSGQMKSKISFTYNSQ